MLHDFIPGDPAVSKMNFHSDEVDVGSQLRKLRTESGLSLRSLAELSGLNVNTLSLIENGKSSPSVSTLQQIAGALRIPITAFFETPFDQTGIVFQKKNERRRVTFDHGILEDLGLGWTVDAGQSLLVNLDAGAESGPDSIIHSGIEFVYCLSGDLEYHIADRAYQLVDGDSLVFKAQLPHRWRNRGSEKAQFILIIVPMDDFEQGVERHFNSK